MKRIVLAVMLLLGVAGGAGAENWVQYGNIDSFKASIDVDSMTIKEDVCIFWTKWDLTPKGRASMFAKEKKLKNSAATMKMKWAAFCGGNDKGVSEMASYIYDKKGNVLESNVPSSPIPYDLVPGSLMEVMHGSVCTVVSEAAAGNAKADEAQ